MPRPISDERRQSIIDALPSGKSCRRIAADHGVSHDTVSRIAGQVGHTFGQTNLARAHSAANAYGKERRALLMVKLYKQAEQIADELDQPYLSHSFGGKDHTYADELLDKPDAPAKRALSQAIGSLVKSATDIDSHDNVDDTAKDGEFDRWLRTQRPEEAA